MTPRQLRDHANGPWEARTVLLSEYLCLAQAYALAPPGSTIYVDPPPGTYGVVVPVLSD